MVSVSTVKPKRIKIDGESWYRWNSVLTVVYLLEAAAIIVAATGTALPVTLNFWGIDTLATSAKDGAVFAPASHHFFDVRISWILALMLLIPAVTHFLMASKFRAAYEKNMAVRQNAIRWVGYGISSGLLVVVFGVLVGMQDFAAILLLFVLNLVAGGLFALAEQVQQKQSSARSCAFWMGAVASLVSWLLVALTAWSAHIYGAGVLSYLHFVYPALLVLSAAIVVNFYLQLRAKGKWADFVYGERIFVVGNFLLVSLATWLIFAGSLRP